SRERISPGSMAVARSNVLARTCQNDGRPIRRSRRVRSSAWYQRCIANLDSASSKRLAVRTPATSRQASIRADSLSTTWASLSMTGWPRASRIAAPLDFPWDWAGSDMAASVVVGGVERHPRHHRLAVLDLHPHPRLLGIERSQALQRLAGVDRDL